MRKLLLASAVSSTDGFDPGGFAAIEDLKAADWIGSPFHEEYARIAPSPDVHTLIHKAKEVVIGFRGWTADDIRSIQAPTLIVIGDAGIVRPEHAVEMFRLFCSDADGDSVERPPNTQLAVLPGMPHVEFMHRTDLLVATPYNPTAESSTARPANNATWSRKPCWRGVLPDRLAHLGDLDVHGAPRLQQNRALRPSMRIVSHRRCISSSIGRPGDERRTKPA